MNWRFTIIDRYGVETVIDEPIGWDKNIAELKRDLEWHGVFFTNQGDEFEFHKLSHNLLKAEYDQYRFEGVMSLRIEEDCGNGYEPFNTSRFDFNKYKRYCGDSCYVKIPVEKSGEIVEIRNRVNQKVNLETLVAFDETTPLPPYTHLPFELELPSKGIFIQDQAKAETDIDESFDGNIQPAIFDGYSLAYEQLEFAMTTKASEIGNFQFKTVQKTADNYSGHTLDPTSINSGTPNVFVDAPGPGPVPAGTPIPFPQLWPLNLDPILNFSNGSPNFGQISNPVQLKFLIKGRIDVLNCIMKTTVFYFLRLKERLELLTNGELLEHYDVIHRVVHYNPIDHFTDPFAKESGLHPGESMSINAAFINNNIIINEGDRFYFFIATSEYKTQAHLDAVDAGGKAFKLTLEENSFFSITNLSHTPSTVSKVFAINEAISRVAESITNNKLRGYSEYFGRTNSQPYSHPADGCGSMEVITDGIRVRGQENKIPGKTNLFSQSLKDLFEGLNPIHNIGVGIEKDKRRPGHNCLRVENWRYFYNNTVVMNCVNVGAITREAHEKEAYSTFQFGFKKWEAEEYTGLDEFLTKRTYRTTLSQLKNDLVQLSGFIGSGYALEITRRKGNEDSKDWRYDKDAFIICTTRKRYFHAIFNEEESTIVFDYVGEPGPFSGDTITVAGTIHNDGTYNVFSVVFSSEGTVTLTLTGDTLTDEESFTTNFPGIMLASNIHVELGNVINPQNIIDPNTLYNYRIRPMYNAMRWMNRVFESYKQFGGNCKLIFTDGDGNYFAEGEMADISCKFENKAIAENETISPAIFQDQGDAMPFLQPERVMYDYPISSQEYKKLEANPYGIITFSNDCEQGEGYIDTIQYKPEEGIASFNLIPKAE